MGDGRRPPAEQRLFDGYPAVSHFLETVVWPAADGPNLIELVHRVMCHWDADFVAQFVEDLRHLHQDEHFSDRELAHYFGRNIPDEWRFMEESNARATLNALAGYAAYLYGEEGVRGHAS
jgi:hypothetical protein